MKAPRLLTPLVFGLVSVLVLPWLPVGGSIVPVSAASFSVTNSKPSGPGFSQLAVSGGSIGRNSPGNGGALLVDDGSATLTHTHLTGNSAKLGGGAIVYAGSGRLAASSAAIAGNSARLRGGAFYRSASTGPSLVPTSAGDNDGDDVLTIVLPDGDVGDGDLTADGKIEDPGGPGLAWPVGGVTVPVHANTLFAPRVRLVALVIALLTAIGVVLGSGLVKR